MAFKRKDEDVQVDQKNTGYATAGRTVTDADITRPNYNYQIGIPQVRSFNYKTFDYSPFSYRDYTEGANVFDARNALNAINANRPGAWDGGQYGDLLKASIDAINNREKFSYDLNGDALYQQYKNQYMNLGRMAMMDTMGQAAAMTGGYGNSYANTAGNQAYQGYLQQLNDRVPELYQLAFDKYNQETQDLYNKANVNNTMYNQEYGQYRDTVSDWENERNYLANRYENERNFDYSVYSDSYNRALNAWQANNDAAYRSVQAYNDNLDREQQAYLTELATQVSSLQNQNNKYMENEAAAAATAQEQAKIDQALSTSTAKDFITHINRIRSQYENQGHGEGAQRSKDWNTWIDDQIASARENGKFGNMTDDIVYALMAYYKK